MEGRFLLTDGNQLWLVFFFFFVFVPVFDKYDSRFV